MHSAVLANLFEELKKKYNILISREFNYLIVIMKRLYTENEFFDGEIIS